MFYTDLDQVEANKIKHCWHDKYLHYQSPVCTDVNHPFLKTYGEQRILCVLLHMFDIIDWSASIITDGLEMFSHTAPHQ